MHTKQELGVSPTVRLAVKTKKLVAVLTAIAVGVFALTILSTAPTRETAAMDTTPTLVVVSSSNTVTSTGTAYFKIGFPPYAETFTIMLTDTARIQEAREIVNGTQTEAIHMMGTIVKSPAFYNPPWSYHLEPASIGFFENAVEVCDATPQGVEEGLDEVCGAFLPKCTWCPWNSVVVEEVYIRKVFLPIVLRRMNDEGNLVPDCKPSLRRSSVALADPE